MNEDKKRGRYQRIHKQLQELLAKTDDTSARMASICAVLHHKMDHYFWTGFYFLKGDRLVVGPYQGPVACQELEPRKGVCWAAVERDQSIVVEDVERFPGHIACDSRSRSELVVPLRRPDGSIQAIFDVDSEKLASFTETDREEVEKILELVFTVPPLPAS